MYKALNSKRVGKIRMSPKLHVSPQIFFMLVWLAKVLPSSDCTNSCLDAGWSPEGQAKDRNKQTFPDRGFKEVDTPRPKASNMTHPSQVGGKVKNT